MPPTPYRAPSVTFSGQGAAWDRARPASPTATAATLIPAITARPRLPTRSSLTFRHAAAIAPEGRRSTPGPPYLPSPAAPPQQARAILPRLLPSHLERRAPLPPATRRAPNHPRISRASVKHAADRRTKRSTKTTPPPPISPPPKVLDDSRSPAPLPAHS